MVHEFERNNKTKPHTHQQEFHSSELPLALQPLTSQPRWVCWRWEWREQEGKPGEGKWTKPSIQCGAGWPAYASTVDPSTWGTYEAAVARVRNGQADGIGYPLPVSRSCPSRPTEYRRDAAAQPLSAFLPRNPLAGKILWDCYSPAPD
jgi:hypothetical protein